MCMHKEKGQLPLMHITFLLQAVWATTEYDCSKHDPKTTRLNLSEKGITSITNPEALPRLKCLDLSKNKLTEIPSAIGMLQSLEVLNLNGNDLALLPIEIGYLHKLKSIKLSNNKNLKMIGDGITNVGLCEINEMLSDKCASDLSVNAAAFRSEDITEDDVYKMLKARPIFWNFDMLWELKTSKISTYRGCTESYLRASWSNACMKYMKYEKSQFNKIKDIIDENEEILVMMYDNRIKEPMRAVKECLSPGFFKKCKNATKKILHKKDEEKAKEKLAKGIGEVFTLLMENTDESTMEKNMQKLSEDNRKKFKTVWEEDKTIQAMKSNSRAMKDFISRTGEFIPGFAFHIKRLVGNILRVLESEKNEEVIIQTIDRIRDGMKQCPYRMELTMNFISQVLAVDEEVDKLKSEEVDELKSEEVSKLKSEERRSLGNFVKTVIKTEKKRLFRHMMTILSLNNNHENYIPTKALEHALNYEIGIDQSGKATIMSKDNAYHLGSILKFFYSLFTPEHAFKVVKEYINADGHMKSKALEQVAKSGLGVEEMKRMCRYKKDISDTSSEYQSEDIVEASDGITGEFVQWYLVELEIVEVPVSSRRHSTESDDSFKSAIDQL